MQVLPSFIASAACTTADARAAVMATLRTVPTPSFLKKHVNLGFRGVKEFLSLTKFIDNIIYILISN
jgi:hypothetical protein